MGKGRQDTTEGAAAYRVCHFRQAQGRQTQDDSCESKGVDVGCCTVCGAYSGEESWRKLCKRCYSKKKRAEELSGKNDYERLWKEALARLNQQSQETIINDDLLKRLIMLCHPDKHGGSLVAEDVTKQLLSIRKSRKGEV